MDEGYDRSGALFWCMEVGIGIEGDESMEKNVYRYEKKAILLDKLSVYANWKSPFILDDTPRYPDIDFSQFRKLNSIHTTSLNHTVQLDQYQNASGEVIYKAEKGPHGIFRLGKLSPYLSSCVAICFVKAPEPSEISLHLICNLPSKVFLNKSLVAMDHDSLDQFVKCKLDEGENILVFECYHVSPDSEINIRLADLLTEEKDRMEALECGNCSVSNRLLSVVYEGDAKSGVLSYYAYLDDSVHLNRNLQVEGKVMDMAFRCIGEFKPCLNKTNTIQLTDYSLESFEIPAVDISFTVRSGDAILYETNRRFVLGDLTHVNASILMDANRTIRDSSLTTYDRYAIKQCIQFACDMGKAPEMVWTQTSYIRSLLLQIRRGLHMEEIYRLPGKHNIHFRSPLDGRDDMYTTVVPQGYTHERKYPLIINISNANRESLFPFYLQNIDQGVIFADFFLKGITLGSYVGEAEFFALFRDIQKRYHIDPDRVYVTGSCNGAYAVYALAQNYPHLFAGIVAVAGGLHLPAIYNLLNIPVYNVFSTTDLLYTRSLRNQHDALVRLPNVRSVSVEACTHTMLMSSMQRKNVIRELLRHTRDSYPRDIRYYTERNCHNKCYWVELHGIVSGSVFAEVEAHADLSSIAIICKNSAGITIRIPPYVKRQCFQVCINGITYHFSRYRGSCLTFALCGGQYILSDRMPQDSQLKGAGIIGVYRKPLTIICNQNSHAEMQVANSLAHPRTMGFQTGIIIAYPIRNYGYVPRRKQNLILLRPHTQASEYDDLLLAKPEDIGFTYQGIFHEGSFLIMEAVEVPKTGSVVLVITYHDERILSSFLFLREMILPGYCNGIHPFLNNRILVFDGRCCNAVYELDAPLMLVGGKSQAMDAGAVKT